MDAGCRAFPRLPGAAGRGPAAAAALFVLALGASGCAAPEQLLRELDKRHATVSRGLADVVDGMDRAFGEARVEDRERIARLKLGAQVTLRENDGPNYSVPIQLRVPLPALERRANIFLQYDSVADVTSGIDEARESLDRSRTLSATVLSRVMDRMDSGVRLELTWRDGPQTGFRPFARWEWRPGTFRLAYEQQVYYLTDKGIGGRSIFEADRIFGDRRSFLRLRTVLEGNQETPGTDFQHALIYRRPYEPWDVALSAEIGVRRNPYDGDPESETPGPEDDPDQSYLQLRVIGTLFRPWIEWEVMPALYRPWRHRDDLEYGVTLMLRIVAEHALKGPDRP